MALRYKIKVGMALFIFKSILSFATSDFNLEELETLKKIDAITQEEYDILFRELTQGSSMEENLYILKIGKDYLVKNYSVINKNGREYFQLQNFLEIIDFKNYNCDSKRVEIYLGTELEEIILDLEKNSVFRLGEELKFTENYPKFLIRDNLIYVEKEVFKRVFLDYCKVDKQKMEIAIDLSFTPPKYIDRLVEINKRNLEEDEAKNQLIFEGKRDWFTLGYADLDIDYYFNKDENSSKYERDWSTDIGYQGGLLFGEFLFNYDMRENEVTGLKLEYDRIVENHKLEITRDRLGSEGLWGARFYKDRGYYEEGGRVRIVETVPLGSRAELLYMGVPIDIQDEVNGRVEFYNTNIKTDREYQLKIYYPDGRIELKDIVTTVDYNRQRVGEIEYDVNFQEVEGHKGIDSNLGFYYGVSNSLTLGFGVDRELTESRSGSKKYLNTMNGEAIFGNTFNGTSYVLKLEGEQALDNFIDSDERRVSNKNLFGYLTEVARDKWKVTYEEKNYGTYYSEKKDRDFSISYDVTKNLTLDYEYNKIKNYDKSIEKYNSLGVDVDYNFKNFLIDIGADLDLERDNKNSYDINFYWNSFRGWTTRWENRWENDGRDYEMSLEVYNNNFGGMVDISAELKYSEKDKESIGLKVNVILDGWFTFDADVDKAGKRNFSVGIDRVIDLKKPKERLNSADVSRANIITFVDENHNNIYDKGERLVPGVEIETGNKKVITNKNGQARMFGLSNGIEYQLNSKIKRPSYSVEENEIKVLSRFSSDVDVYIPIKPMINLSGYVNLDENLNLKPEARNEFYSNIIIQILDSKNQEIELASPDNEGYFDISGLYSGDYVIKVHYIGDDYKIPDVSQKLKLNREKNEYEYGILLNVSKDEIKIVEE